MKDNVIEIQGWQGKSGIDIVEKNKDYIILRQWRKEKETKENIYTDTKVYIKDIEFVWGLLRNNFEVGQEYGSHFVWRVYVKARNLVEKEGVSEDYLVDHFLGYRQKKKGKGYYFDLYYCLKSLEAIGNLTIFGGGSFMLITKKDVEF